MAAVFSVYFDFGGADASPATSQDVDALGPPTIRFKQADNATIDSVAPIPIPTSGNNFSYWKNVYLKCDTAPSTQVDNVKFYTDGTAFGTGVRLWVANTNPQRINGNYTGYEVSDAAVAMSSTNTQVVGVTDAFTFTSGSPRTCTISEAGNIINAISETTNYLVLQMTVDSSASPGDLANETLTIQYDEI